METTNITNARLRQSTFSLLSIGILFSILVSCNSDDATSDFISADTESANLDTMDDSFFEDADNLVETALADADGENTGGKVSADERLACATVERSGTSESGSLKVDFGEGCVDPRGNERKGVILVERQGAWDVPGSYWTIHFMSYSINGIVIEGTRKVVVVSVTDTETTFDVTLEGGKITWPDGRTGTREVRRRRIHERGENHILDRLIIYGTAQGTLCNGRSYFIDILEPLIYDRACWAEGVIIPVQGKKFIKHGNRELTIDYGTGDCDNIVTLTNKNGKTVRHEVGK